MHADPQATVALPAPTKNGSRARSLPYRKPFVIGVALWFLFFLGMLAAGTAIVVFSQEPSVLATRVFVGSLGFSGLAWLLAFFKRRSAFCPLCKGTPLMNSGALAHSKAVRLPPLNHGVTAMLSIAATQEFRCMYCGSHFDLLKEPAHRRHQRNPGQNPEDPYYEDDSTAADRAGK